MITHIVKLGETIYQVSQKHNTSVQRIISDNGLIFPYSLVEGQALIITEPTETHTVKPGETPECIALTYNISTLELYQNNPDLSYRAPLYPNQMLVIHFQDEKIRTLSTNGYIYPHINRHLLIRTLPFLTYLSIYSYGMNENGDLIPVDDSNLISNALAYQALPVLVLNGRNETGTFSSLLIQKLFHNKRFQDTVLDQIIQTMLQKGYRGLEPDFLTIAQAEPNAFLSFLENAKLHLHKHGLFLHIALPIKSEQNLSGQIFGTEHFREIGSLCDRVLLMTYEWGNTYVRICYILEQKNEPQTILRFIVTGLILIGTRQGIVPTC